MITDTEDTITAIATPAGRSALGIVRISGNKCKAIIENVFRPRRKKQIIPFRPILGKIMLGSNREIDEAIMMFYRQPRSYTREDLAEITCHGNPLILEEVVTQIVSHGARLARPGEFTYRAFLNGRLDLTQAEAVADLISADTELQVELALHQLEGRLSDRLKLLSSKLLELIALLEGNIDFSEEQHYHFITAEEAARRAQELTALLAELLGTFERGHYIKEGFSVALVGKPNVGKSSVFNYLVGKDRAIVTSIPGTTRDYIEERIKIGPYLVKLLDTAGIRESDEAIEKEGIRRSRLMIDRSDIVLFLVDGSAPLDSEDRMMLDLLGQKERIILSNKSDLPGFQPVDGSLPVSAISGSGMHAILDELEDWMNARVRYSDQDSLISSMRHRDILVQALEAVGRARASIAQKQSEEFAVTDLHIALNLIGQITGEVTIEDIYSHIFSNFCIGK